MPTPNSYYAALQLWDETYGTNWADIYDESGMVGGMPTRSQLESVFGPSESYSFVGTPGYDLPSEPGGQTPEVGAVYGPPTPEGVYPVAGPVISGTTPKEVVDTVVSEGANRGLSEEKLILLFLVLLLRKMGVI